MDYMLKMDLSQKKHLLDYLSGFITENKKNKFDEIIKHRTRYITVVLEDIFQTHNASAVLRTCDCFGIQDVHIIENKNKYEVNSDVALGASKWLNLIKYNKKENNTYDTLSGLKKQGYRIIATSPHKNDTFLKDFSIKGKFALVFGTELEGLTDIVINNADEFVKIPMYGFTESFNISLSAALSLFYFSEKLRHSKVKWQLTEEEIIDIKINWAKSVVKRPDLLIKKFASNYRKLL